MKSVLRRIIIYSFLLYFLPMIIPGVSVTGGFLTFLIGGVALTILFLVIKPILGIISFPINFVTLGFFSLVTNAIIIYLLTIFVSGIIVAPFSYPRTEFLGFVIPRITFSMLLAYIYTAFVVSFIDSFFKWLLK